MIYEIDFDLQKPKLCECSKHNILLQAQMHIAKGNIALLSFESEIHLANSRYYFTHL